MEFIPSKHTVEFKFKISSTSYYPLTDKTFAEIEGSLSILINEEIIFDESDILLAELAASLNIWLNNLQTSNNINWCYESMDYEDSPILGVTIDKDKITIDSVWLQSITVKPVVVEKKSFIEGASLFISQFEKAIPGINDLWL